MADSKPQPKASSKAASAVAAAAGPEASAAVKLAQKAKAKKTAKTAGKALTSGNRRTQTLKAEWLIGVLLIFGYPLVKPGAFDDFNFWVSRLLAWSLCYLGLMLAAEIGPRTSRLASAFGGLVLIGLMIAPFHGGTFGAAVIGESANRLNSRPNENATPNTNVAPWLKKLLAPPPPPPPPGAPPLPLVHGSSTTPPQQEQPPAEFA